MSGQGSGFSNADEKTRRSPTPLSHDALCEGIRRRLVNHRLARRLNVNQAAKLAGFSRTGLERMENGDVQPTLESLTRLAAFYGDALPAFFAGVYEDCGVAQGERVRLFAKETKAQEHEALLLELSVRLGLSEWLEEFRLLAALSDVDPDLGEHVRAVVHALAQGRAKLRDGSY